MPPLTLVFNYFSGRHYFLWNDDFSGNNDSIFLSRNNFKVASMLQNSSFPNFHDYMLPDPFLKLLYISQVSNLDNS